MFSAAFVSNAYVAPMPPRKSAAEKKHNSSGKILVGTASWTDPGFVEHWYPKGMPAADRLAWYAEQFQMVEINSTFYAVPDPRMIERWCRSTPDGFVFDVKLHQLLSRHSTAAKLLPPAVRRRAEVDTKGKVKLTPALEEAMIAEVLGPVKLLEAFGKLGALLLQMSPAFSPKMHQLKELETLLHAFKDYRVAIELRNRNWAQGERLQETLRILPRAFRCVCHSRHARAGPLYHHAVASERSYQSWAGLPAPAWARCESLYHRQDSGVAFQL